MVRAFANGPGRHRFNPRSSHTKDSKKCHLMLPCLELSMIRYESMGSGAIQGRDLGLKPGLLDHRLIDLVVRVFTNGPGDLGSIPGRVILKTLKMALDTSSLNTQQYKVRIKGKVEQSMERSSALPYTSV